VVLWLVASVLVLLASGVAAVSLSRRPVVAAAVGAWGAVVGCLLGLPAVVAGLAGHSSAVNLPWSMPLGSLSVAIDPLSAVFATPVLVVGALAAVYGQCATHTGGIRHNPGWPWFGYDALLAAMIVVTIARNGVLFLLGWEVMSLASFFLVMNDHDKDHVRRAAWTYLIAMHLGTAFLFAMFARLGAGASTLDFAVLGRFAATSPEATLVFLLALVGFGTKAGFVPVHVWAPDADTVAPSHVAAVMSGVMTKMGIYGLLRVVLLLGDAAAWWGWALVVVGAVSGVVGVTFALAQQDLKRLLAYSSVENLGIVAMGLGVGVLGVAQGNPAVAALGLAGALLHVLNHSLFKSLMFLGAGAIVHVTATKRIDALGGVLKRMPTTGAAMIVGALAISALPPLNGFVSELLIYLGAFQGVAGTNELAAAWPMRSLLVLAALALISGLAAATFTKVVGIALLGEPRTKAAAHAHETPRGMRAPMVVLAALCVLLGLGAPLALEAVRQAVLSLTPGAMVADVSARLVEARGQLVWVTVGGGMFLSLLGGLMLLRRWLLKGREVTKSGTWDCGYIAPTERMQYSGASFAEPLLRLFSSLLRPTAQLVLPNGLFPTYAKRHNDANEPFVDHGYRPIFQAFAWVAAHLRWVQRGHIQMYVLYIAATLIVLLVWKLG
jgi:hydrogenase-4 component B